MLQGLHGLAGVSVAVCWVGSIGGGDVAEGSFGSSAEPLIQRAASEASL